MENVLLALIAAFTGMATGIIAPILISYMDTRARRADKAQDWARQDAVAAQAREAASLLLERQEAVAAQAREAAKLLLASNERTEGYAVDQLKATTAGAQETADKLDTIKTQGEMIHKLVNSQLSAAIQAERDALAGQLVALKDLVKIRKLGGILPSAESLEVINVIEKRLLELESTLDKREKDTTAAIADAEKKRGG